jgi:hypothetical protein
MYSTLQAPPVISLYSYCVATLLLSLSSKGDCLQCLFFSSSSLPPPPLHPADMDEMCYEERVLYRLFSGMHTATNVHINWNYYPPRKGVRDVWEPNPNRFMQQYEQHQDWIDNMYFAYVVLLRAVKKASPMLEHHHFDVGMPDAEVRVLFAARGFGRIWREGVCLSSWLSAFPADHVDACIVILVISRACSCCCRISIA